MSKTIIVGVILLHIVFLGFIFISNKRKEPKSPQISQVPNQTQSVDKQASFAIFTHGTFRVFTASMYHNLSSDVYIEASNPNIIRVKKAEITWNDFFSTLPFKLTKDCLTTGTKEIFCTGANGSLQFYLNGSPEPNALDKEINHSDQLLISFGTENEPQIQKQLQQLSKIK